MQNENDPFDLAANPLPPEGPGTRKLWLDNQCVAYAVVDEIDYQWASQWKWNLLIWHGHGTSRATPKCYARRSPSRWTNGKRKVITLLLHVEIMKRKGDLPPSPEYCMVDHWDGDGLNCTRKNLQWLTPKLNALGTKKARRILKQCIVEEIVSIEEKDC